MYERIRRAIEAAARNQQKMAMFHYQVLSNANAPGTADADEFCRAAGVPKTYRTEFRKILSLARLMRELGAK